MHPIEVTKDYAVLTVDYSIPADSASSADLYVSYLMSPAAGSWHNEGSTGVRIVDFSTERIWRAGHNNSTVDYKPATDPNASFSIKPGESKKTTTFFAPVDTDTVDVLIPLLGLAWDVPVVGGNADTRTVESLKFDNKIVFPEPMSLTSFIQAYDNGTVKKGRRSAADHHGLRRAVCH